MSIQIGEHITLPDFPLLLAPMEDVSDPPFRFDIVSVYFESGLAPDIELFRNAFAIA